MKRLDREAEAPGPSKRKHVAVAEQSEEPANWEEHLENIREMRKNRSAPVDSQGANSCYDSSECEKVQRFQILLSLMLSSQTRDEITFQAMEKLKEHGATVEKILVTDLDKIQELIYPVGMYRKKAKYVKEVASIMEDKFDSDIPSTVKELCSLPGVGPKMAHLTMELAWGETTGIAVDTHVHRVSNRLAWVKTKNAESTRKALESWIPRELWKEINILMVGFGQEICLASNPKCAQCLNNSLCPYYNKKTKNKKS